MVTANDLADGFTTIDVDRAVHPDPGNWTPPGIHEEMTITSLVPGLKAVKLSGRIVNINAQSIPLKAPNGARLCVNAILKDDAGAISVRQLLDRCHIRGVLC